MDPQSYVVSTTSATIKYIEVRKLLIGYQITYHFSTINQKKIVKWKEVTSNYPATTQKRKHVASRHLTTTQKRRQVFSRHLPSSQKRKPVISVHQAFKQKRRQVPSRYLAS